MVPGGGCGITYSLVVDWLMSPPTNVSGFMFIDRALQMMASNAAIEKMNSPLFYQQENLQQLVENLN